jgi:hypothetical protein
VSFPWRLPGAWPGGFGSLEPGRPEAGAARGKDPAQFPTALATFAARAVRAGRRVCGQDPARDVLSPPAQTRHSFVVQTLPGYSTLSGNPLEEALAHNTVTPPPEAVAFRMDFPAWLGTLGTRKRSIAQELMVGERTRDVAGRYGLCPGRVSQLRREFRQDWQRFCGDLPGGDAPAS